MKVQLEINTENVFEKQGGESVCLSDIFGYASNKYHRFLFLSRFTFLTFFFILFYFIFFKKFIENSTKNFEKHLKPQKRINSLDFITRPIVDR